MSYDKKRFAKRQRVEGNSHLKVESAYGQPSYSFRITMSQLPDKNLLETLLTDKFYYHYLVKPNEKNEFNLLIGLTENNVALLKPLIPVLMQNARTNTVWCSLTTEYDCHGITLPPYILALVKEEFVLGLDFSFIVI